MYRSNIQYILYNREPIRKQAYSLLDTNYRLVYGILRERDRRKYKGQSEWVYRTYLHDSDDYFDALTAIRELTRIQNKMRMWWYYEGTVELDDGTKLPVRSKYTLEEALETFADRPSGSPHYIEFSKRKGN